MKGFEEYNTISYVARGTLKCIGQDVIKKRKSNKLIYSILNLLSKKKGHVSKIENTFLIRYNKNKDTS